MPSSPAGGSDQPRRRTMAEVKLWVEEITTTHRINQQGRLIAFLLRAYGGMLIATMGLLTLTFGAVFKEPKKG